MTDLALAVRLLAKQRVLSLAVVVTLALGISATVLMFTIVNGVLLRPLPFPAAERLVNVKESAPGGTGGMVAAHSYLTWRERNRSFDHLAAAYQTERSIEGFGEPVLVSCSHITSNFFDVIGIQPALGRTFDPSIDDNPIMLSHEVWKSLGADPNIIGSTLRMVDRPFVVVGVMPPLAVTGQYVGLADVWIRSVTDRISPENRPSSFRGRHVIGRLKPGVSVAQAHEDLSAIQGQLTSEYPQFYTDVGVTVAPLQEIVVGGVRPVLTTLLAAAAFLLLIACANVANLLLARSAVRQKEVAIRLALGATRWQIARQFLTESLVLSAIGGALGMLAARFGLAAFAGVAGPMIPRTEAIAVDIPVMVFAVVVAAVTGILFGLAPALAGARGDIAAVTKDGTRGSSHGPASGRLRRLLVASEVALAIVLLAGSGLLIRSFLKLAEVDLGFRTAQVLTANLRVLDLSYPEAGGVRQALLQRLLSGLRALPGVTHVGASYYFPLRERQLTHFVVAEGDPDPSAQGLAVENTGVIGDYLQAMGVPLVRGRLWSEEEMWSRPGSVVVSASMARTLWPDDDPIGKRLTHNRATPGEWMTVIGVVGDVRQRSVEAAPLPQWYFPYSAFRSTVMTLALRSTADPASLAGVVRQTIRDIDPNLPVHDVEPLEALVDRTTMGRRLAFWLLGGFAAMSLLLAGFGVYATVANGVAQQTREIAIRVALGATPATIVRLIMRDGLATVGVGCVVGVSLSLIAARLMQGLLFGVASTDAVSFAAAVCILGAIAAATCYLPARRAASIDPASALQA